LKVVVPDELRMLGADHPDTLKTRRNLTFCRKKLGILQAGDRP
jgi:hypothetical protein